jgi:hypothetical protein
LSATWKTIPVRTMFIVTKSFYVGFGRSLIIEESTDQETVPKSFVVWELWGVEVDQS